MATSITPPGLSPPAADLPGPGRVDVQVGLQPGAPLVDQFLAVDHDEGGDVVVGDDRAGHDGLAGARRGDKHTEIVRHEIGDGGCLLGAERPDEAEPDTGWIGAVIDHLQSAAEVVDENRS
jgi:hypothetical protein